ncbi:MAG: type II secretion system protein [Pseudomonadota bacterium]
MTEMHCQQDPQGGFTLFEVLISLIVVSLVLSVIIPNAVSDYRQTANAYRRIKALALANRKLIDAVNRNDPTSAPLFGRSDNMSWTLVVRASKNKNQAIQLIKIDILISDTASSKLLATLSSQMLTISP